MKYVLPCSTYAILAHILIATIKVQSEIYLAKSVKHEKPMSNTNGFQSLRIPK